MPTGYTYKVSEGKITTLKDYALECARAFGALIHMRDEPMDAPIPDIVPLSKHYYEAVKNAIEELEAFSNVNYEEAAYDDYSAEKRRRDIYIEEQKLTKARYNAMFEKVNVWDCKVEGIKKFMLEQLDLSIKNDCRDDLSWWPEPVLLTAEQYKAKESARLASNLARATEEYKKAVKRNNEQNEWLRGLMECIG